MHLLLLKKVAIKEIEIADSALKTFYERIPEMYGDATCTANAHSIIHLPNMVKQWVHYGHSHYLALEI